MENTVKNCTICNQIGQERCPEHVNTDHFEQKFYEWVGSDNVIEIRYGVYVEQSGLYQKEYSQNELASFFYKEYYKSDYPDNRSLLFFTPAITTIEDVATGKTEEVKSDEGFTSITTTESQEDIDCRESLYNQYIQEYSYIGDLPISDDMKQRIITDMIQVGDDAYKDGRKSVQ